MQWIFIIGDQSLSLSTFSNMTFQDNVRTYLSGEEFQIHYENQEYAVFSSCPAETLKADFEVSEYKELMKKLPFENPQWFMLKYSGLEILKKIISEEEFPDKVFLYCDGIDPGLREVFDEYRIIIS